MNFHMTILWCHLTARWQAVHMALADLQDMGAWDPDDQIWYGGPGGLIEWFSVQRFQSSSETAAQPEAEIFIIAFVSSHD